MIQLIRPNRPFQYLAVLFFTGLLAMPALAERFAESFAEDSPASPAAAVSAWKIINYWSTSCAPCRVEIPELNSLSAALAPLNVQVLGVNFDDESSEVTRKRARRMQIQFPNLTMAEAEALGLTAPSVLPTTYILSPENVVMAKLVGLQTRDSLMLALADLGVNL
ncbi:MAG: thiol-disulfide isomerase/thioredoxin [Candidatus Pseudothioglobus sp.]